jgi:heme-degrading monooxygenase HmoA
MFVLHVVMQVKPGQLPAFEELFRCPFRAAISAQPGFKDVQLLKPQQDGDPILAIRFETQALQQQWVATDLHGRLWPQMEVLLQGYSLAPFTTA